MNFIADELRKNYEPVDPMDFYRDIFPDGELEEQGEYVDGKYCAIALEICYNEKRRRPKKTKSGEEIKNLPLVKRYSVTNGLDEIDSLLWNNNNFCLMAPISYAGKTRQSVNARFMYALCVEIDYLRVNPKDGSQVGLAALFYQFENEVAPKPTYIVASGSGVHLYYLWEYPLPMFQNVVKQLTKYKKKLTKKLWNKYITDAYDNVQQQSIFQAFRMPGTITKKGDRVEVFKIGERVSIEYMNKFVPQTYQIEYIEQYKSNLSLAKAKELYPEWYQRRIVEGQPRKRWVCNRGLYDWWKNKIKEEIKFGARWHGLRFLATYAIKCDISEEELRKDCYELKVDLNKLTPEPGEEFTDYDVECAIQFFYDKGYVNYPASKMAHHTKLDFPKNTRNGRKRMEHLQADYLIDKETGRPKTNTCKQNRELALQYMRHNGEIKGRPSAEQKVKEWRKANPDGKKAECIRDLKLDKKTVYKWWGGETNE